MGKSTKATYDHPNFLVVRDAHLQGAFSSSASGTDCIGSTLRTYTKSLITGVTIIVASGGSVGGSNSIGVCRNVSGTRSLMHTEVTTVDKGASALGHQVDISLTTGYTLASVGSYAVLIQTADSFADKGVVIKDVIWRYRILPDALE